MESRASPSATACRDVAWLWLFVLCISVRCRFHLSKAFCITPGCTSPMIPTRSSLPVTPAPGPQHLGSGSVSRCGRFAGRYSEPFRRSQGREGLSQRSVRPASLRSVGAGEGRWGVSLAAALGRPLAFVLGSAPRPTRVCSALWRLGDVLSPTTWLGIVLSVVPILQLRKLRHGEVVVYPR